MTTAHQGDPGSARRPLSAAAVVQRRLESLDIGRMRDEHSAVYDRWTGGHLRPEYAALALAATPGGERTLSAVLGVPETDVVRWRTGEVYPTWDAVCVLSTAAGLPPDLLTSAVETADSGPEDRPAAAETASSHPPRYPPDVIARATRMRGQRLGQPRRGTTPSDLHGHRTGTSRPRCL